MGYEVEMKVFIADESVERPKIKERIDSYIGREGSFIDKEDVYYHVPGDSEPSFRIRDEGDRLLITSKVKHKDGKVECNRELEFEHRNTSDRSTMEEMARLLGYEILRTKHKRGFEWQRDRVHIELLKVTRLGWYLEIEAIAEDNSQESTQPLKEEILGILDDLGYSENDLEVRGYHRMLRALEEKEGGKGNADES